MLEERAKNSLSSRPQEYWRRLLASRPNIVSLVNADTIQVVKKVQGNASYYISSIDDIEALVECECQSDINK